MKKINIFLLGLLVFFAACEDPFYQVESEGKESLATQNFTPVPSSAKEIMLDQLNPQTRLFFQWGEAEAGLNSPVNYVFMMDTEDGDFSEPILIDSVGPSNEFMIQQQELRAALEGAGLDVVEGARVAWKAAAFVETNEVEMPKFITTIKLDMFDTYIIGSFRNTAWSTHLRMLPDPENPLLKSAVVYAPENSEFKFTTAPNWDNGIFGFVTPEEGEQYIANDPGSNNLYFGGGDTPQNEAGYYRVTFNTDERTFTAESLADAEAPAQMFIVVDGETVAMTQDADDSNLWAVEQVPMTIGAKLLFAEDEAASEVYGLNPDYPNAAISKLENPQAIEPTLPRDGNFDVTFNTLTGEYDISAYDPAAVIDSLYLVGSGSLAGWNPSNAVPMDQNADYPVEWSIVTYFADPASDGVKFVGSQADWGDLTYNIGLNGSTAEVDNDLANGSNDNVTVDGEAGYYRFTINTQTWTYEVEPVTPEADVQNEMYVVGSGIVGVNNWDPSVASEMTQSTNTPYRFSVEVELEENAEFKFIAQRDWSPVNFGYADNTDIFSGFVQDGGNIKFNKPAGNYRIRFDYFAGQLVIESI